MEGFSISTLITAVLVLVVLVFLVQGMVYLYQWWQKKRQFQRIIDSGLPSIDQMDGAQFEYFLVELFRQLQYRAKGSKASHDYGADLILDKENRIVVQAKRYGVNKKVGIKAVQEVYFAQTYFQAEEAWVLTNSLFTQSARKGADKTGVKLFDRKDLQRWLLQVNPALDAKTVVETVKPKERKCPACGGRLEKRTSKHGAFMGCNHYPNCTHTEPVNAKN
ncbi:hypothetical protein CHL76_12140 [Marinococcus halophilus]|uniref:Restriction endonuclease n=1 Tax=Marinococcus halophilus TaxID=1371 RepID=A0A510Y7R2_MARHA|nr:restriction endonuclease [Marinococcus halophilus]OZT79655.1 hypothetical protein CHL76_12140 [Marinococcus halophilus]GEK59402.1 hypothetical protein MHA01_23070 [Marinococcus halophilus]